MTQSFRYATASKTGLDGPDQVLTANEDITYEKNGRVRIKLNSSEYNSYVPISIPGILTNIAKRYPNHIALVSAPDLNGEKTIYTYQQYEEIVRTIAKAFLKLGLERHHNVCILGFNCPEWLFSYLAAIYAGGIGSGIYITNSPKACEYCIKRSQTDIVLVDDEKQLKKILQIRHNLPDLKAIVQFKGTPTEEDVLSWNDLLEMGKKETQTQLKSVLKTIGVNECCTLVYTSGTVGNPKMVMLSHDNLLFAARMLAEKLDIMETSDTVVSYLPLSHIAAMICDIILIISKACTTYFANPDALKDSLLQTLLLVQPTIFFAVPRVWEKIYEKIQEKAHSNSKIKTYIADWAKMQSLHYHINKMNGTDYKYWSYIFAKWLIFDKIKTALGLNKSRIFCTGAATIRMDIKKYFLSLDIPLIEIYGMSECSGPHSIVTNEYNSNTVRTDLFGICTKINNINEYGEGEICMNGRHIFMGYLNNPEKTVETKDKDGWLHSGDLGKLDSNRLYITGRIKELIITSGGENISPNNIEQAILSELPVLNNVILIGESRKYLTVLVTLKNNMNSNNEPLDTLDPNVIKWARSLGSQAETVTEIINSRDPVIYEEIDKAIKRANAHAISNAQKVQKFEILPRGFSIATDELGPTLKIKKNVVFKIYADLINKMYE